MSQKQNEKEVVVDPFAGIEDAKDSEIVLDDRKWGYPNIGFDARDGVLYIGDEEAEEVEIVVVNVRQRKRVKIGEKQFENWGLYTPKSAMPPNVKAKSSCQLIVMVNGKPHKLTLNSWNGYNSMFNPASGEHHNERLQAGLIVELNRLIVEAKKKHGKTASYCWFKTTITKTDPMPNPKAGKKAVIYGMKYTPPVFVGAEEAAKYEAFYYAEEIDEWAKGWKDRGKIDFEGDTGDQSAAAATVETITEEDVEQAEVFEI